MNIVFMGTPQFAVPALENLKEAGHNIQLVVTQPDRPSGRGKKMKESEIKKVAIKMGVEVFQPRSVKEAASVKKIQELNPDFIVVIAYGQILSKEILDIPKFGCINVHASLLPKLRGAAPINWAIMKGYSKTGITTMLMDTGLDTGDILLKKEILLDEIITAGELHDILSEIGGNLILDTIKGIVDRTIVPEKQDNEQSSYAPMLDKELAKLKWDDSAVNIHNKIRGLNPDHVAFFSINNINIKVHSTEYCMESTEYTPGTVFKVDKSGIYIAVKEGYIIIKSLQMPGKNKVYIDDFLRGNRFPEGIVLR